MLESARERSTVSRLMSDARDRLRTAFERSTLVCVLRRDTPSTLACAFANSRLETVISSTWSARTRAQRAVTNSKVVRPWVTLRRYVESSFSYRWLASGLNPNVVVVDLRETRTIGPSISAVNWTVRELVASTPTSTGVRISSELASFVRGQPVRAVSLVVFFATIVSLVLHALTGTPTVPFLAMHLSVGALAVIGFRSRPRVEEVLETRFGQIIISSFEPPKPPESFEEGPRRSSVKTEERQ